MAILFIDGFDNYNTITQKWSATGVSFGNTSPTPRFSTGKWLFVTGGQILLKFLPSSYATLFAGQACYFSALTGAESLSFYDSATIQVGAFVNANGSISVKRGTTVLGTSAIGLVSVNTWNHIGLKATIDPSAGAYTVYLNGVSVLTATGANTRNTSNSSANQVGHTSGGGQFIDDFYVGDTSGASPQNDFIGDCRIDTQYPASAGNYTQWTPSTGSNWQNVDETPPNGDTDYNSDATVGHIDSFVPTPIVPLSGTVYARQTNLYARKDDAAVRKIAPHFRHSTTDYAGADMVLPSSYAYDLQIFQTNPANGSAAWTVSDCNNDEIGYKTTA